MTSNQSLQMDNQEASPLTRLPSEHDNHSSNNDASSSSNTNNKPNNKQKPEAWLEVLCQDKVSTIICIITNSIINN
jgi:hypothetical protein